LLQLLLFDVFTEQIYDDDDDDDDDKALFSATLTE